MIEYLLLMHYSGKSFNQYMHPYFDIENEHALAGTLNTKIQVQMQLFMEL